MLQLSMRFSTRILYIIHIAMLILLPLAMFHKTSELFELNKITLIYIASIIVFSVSLYIHYRHKYINLPRILVLPLFIFIVSQLIATLLSTDIHTSLFGYYGRFNGGLFSLLAYSSIVYSLIILFQLLDKECVNKFKSIWFLFTLITSFIVVIWGLPGLFGKDLSCLLFTKTFSNNCWTEMFKPAERMFSTLGQPNWLGSYLLISMFTGIGYFIYKFKDSTVVQKLLFYIWFFTIFFGLLSTRSRSTLLAFILLLPILLLLLIYAHIRKIRSINKKGLTLIFFLMLIVSLFKKTGISSIDKYVPSLYSPKATVVNGSSNIETPILVTDSFDIRKVVWKGAIDIIKNNLITGTGPETFAYTYYRYRPQEHNLTSEWDYVYNKAHNEILNIFAGSGLVGISGYFIYVISTSLFMLIVIKRFISKKDPVFFIYSGLFLAWLSIHITNFFGFSTTVINWYFFIIPVFFYDFSSKNSIILKDSQRKNHVLVAIPLFLLSTYCIIRVILFYSADLLYSKSEVYESNNMYYDRYLMLSKALSLHYEPIYEDKFAYSTAQLALIISATEGPNSNTVRDLMNQADRANLNTLRLSPKNVFYWRTRAKIMYLFDTIDETNKYYDAGLQAIKRAIDLAPTDPRLYYTYATIEMMHNQDKRMTEQKKKNITDLYLKSIQLKPNYREARIALAEWYEKLGENKKAKENYKYIIENINPLDKEAEEAILRN